MNRPKIIAIVIPILLLTSGISYWLVHPRASIPPASPSAPQPAKQNTLILTDHLNRHVEIALPVRRMVSCFPAFTEILIALNAQPLLAGVNSKDSEKLGLPGVGSHLKPDLEAIAACKPDLILVSALRPEVADMLASRLPELKASLLAFHPSTVDGSLELIRTMGNLTGRQKEADQILEQAAARLAAIRSNLPPQRPRVFIEVRSSPSLLTCGKQSVLWDMIRCAGGDPLFEAGAGVSGLDLESVIKANPDFYLQLTGTMNPHPTPPSEHPVLGQLECVKAGHVAQISDELVRPGPRVAEAVGEIQRLFQTAAPPR
ncbi:MAG: ABC transporter substrate-binding protein [Verrucomicrobiae bacterium]|nr:ABC transporter substrate-binding protein [Verrucomicrobiae bacterium]